MVVDMTSVSALNTGLGKTLNRRSAKEKKMGGGMYGGLGSLMGTDKYLIIYLPGL